MREESRFPQIFDLLYMESHVNNQNPQQSTQEKDYMLYISSNKCIIIQSFDNIFKKNRSKSTKTSLFSYILITFAYSYAIKAGQILV